MAEFNEVQQRFWLELQSKGDALCPCCDKMARIRRGTINKGMAKVLLRIVALTVAKNQEWLHIREIFGSDAQKHRDWTQLKHWGLIEPRDVKTSTENASGYWRATSDGHEFAQGELSVAKHVYTYNNEVFRTSSESITIHDAVGEAFDYRSVFHGF